MSSPHSTADVRSNWTSKCKQWSRVLVYTGMYTQVRLELRFCRSYCQWLLYYIDEEELCWPELVTCEYEWVGGILISGSWNYAVLNQYDVCDSIWPTMGSNILPVNSTGILLWW